MQTCSKCSTQWPDTTEYCGVCNSDLSVWSTMAIALKSYQENPRVTYIRVINNGNCCPACQELYGAYAKDNVPSLPVKECSHGEGCRCSYQPFLNDVFP